MSKFLISEPPLQVLPSLAMVIGLNEAIVLQQLHYWIRNHAKIKHNGRMWIYKTIDRLREQDFPFWSNATIKRSIANLHKLGLIMIAKLANNSFNRVNHYSINYEKLSEIHDKYAASLLNTDEVNLHQSDSADCTEHGVNLHQSDRVNLHQSDELNMSRCIRDYKETNEETNKDTSKSDISLSENDSGCYSKKPATKPASKSKFNPADYPINQLISLELWVAYHDMRDGKKKPATEYACKILVNKLIKFSNAGLDPNQALENSITNAWVDLYEPKPATTSNKKGINNDNSKPKLSLVERHRAQQAANNSHIDNAIRTVR